MKIDIYIITLWKGTNFAKGSGAYGILLEVVKDGTPLYKRALCRMGKSVLSQITVKGSS